MDEKVVKKALLFSLFAGIVFLSIIGMNAKPSFSGGSVYSSENVCTNLGGSCSIGCEEGYHSVGAQDCRLGATGGAGGVGVITPVSGVAVCGNLVCEIGENSNSCPADCNGFGGLGSNGTETIQCYDEVCFYGIEDNPSEPLKYCPADCGIEEPVCGNNVCEPGETEATGWLACLDDCDAPSGGSSPLIFKDDDSRGLTSTSTTFAVYDTTGRATLSPVCCILNECYSNSDCSANSYCENYECVPNVNRILTSEDSISLSETVQKTSCVREGDRMNYFYDMNDLTYTFIVKNVVPDKERVTLLFRNQNYYLFGGESKSFDLNEDRVDDVQLLISEINSENCVDVYISKIEKPKLSAELEFFGTQTSISPNYVAGGAFILLLSLVLIAESIKIIKKSKKSKRR